MKTPALLFATIVALTAVRAADAPAEVNARLTALEEKVNRLAGQAPTRWATVDRDRLRSAIYALGREKIEQLKLTENLKPEQTAQVERYEQLNRELLQLPLRFPSLPPRSIALPSPTAIPVAGTVPKLVAPAAPSLSAPTEADKERAALTQQVAEAKAPVAAIIDRRNQITMRYNANEFLDTLVADYVKGRFDLVVNASSHSSSDRSILFRASSSAPDLTDELLAFLREREQGRAGDRAK